MKDVSIIKMSHYKNFDANDFPDVKPSNIAYEIHIKSDDDNLLKFLKGEIPYLIDLYRKIKGVDEHGFLLEDHY